MGYVADKIVDQISNEISFMQSSGPYEDDVTDRIDEGRLINETVAES